MKYTYFICFVVSDAKSGIIASNGVIDLEYKLDSVENFKKLTDKLDADRPGSLLVNFILMNG